MRQRRIILVLRPAAALALAGVFAAGTTGAATTAPAAGAATVPATRAAVVAITNSAWNIEGMDDAQQALARLQQLRITFNAKAPDVEAALRADLAALDKIAIRLDEEIQTNKKAPIDPKHVADLLRLRSQRCPIELLRGELYRGAALALPADSPGRAEHLTHAVTIFKELRVEYHDLTLGLLGYLGESEVQRALGDAKAAGEALAPALAFKAQDPAGYEVHRLAVIESLEVMTWADPAKAIADGAKTLKSTEFDQHPEYQGRIRWIMARAAAAQTAKLIAQKAKADQIAATAAAAAGALREPALIDAAPPYDRLSELARLEQLQSQPLLTREEVLAWADARAATGHPDAATFYARARTLFGDQDLPTPALLAYAGVLRRQGSWPLATEILNRALARLDSADPQRRDVLQWQAAVLVQWLQQSAAPDAALMERTQAALEQVLAADLPTTLRLDALRQLVGLRSRQSLADCVKLIDDHHDLAGTDPYLLCVRAAADFQLLQTETAAKNIPETQARQQANVLAQGLQQTAAAARRNSDPHTTAYALLLQAQVLGQAPLHNTRAALDLLKSNQAALASDPAMAGPAARLTVEMYLEAGLFDDAAAVLAQMPGGATTMPTTAPTAFTDTASVLTLRLAEALAQRYQTAEPDRRAELQKQVLKLVNQARAGSTGDEGFHLAIGRRAANVLVLVGAAADALATANELLGSESSRNDPKIQLELSLIKVQALIGSSQQRLAMDLLNDLAQKFPKSARVQLSRGQCQLALAQAAAATESFRQARQLSKAGGGDWWQATLGLCRALKSSNQAAAAADILRVASALQPEPVDPVLRRDLILFRNGLATAATQPH